MDVAKRAIRKFGKRLKELRLQAGLTQEQLAEALDFDTTFISKVENAKSSPSLANMARIAKALDVPLSAFFNWD